MEIHFEQIRPEEAEAFYALMKQIDQEAPYMLYYPDERKKDINGFLHMIANVQEHGILLGARNEEGRLVGFITAEGNPLRKIAHQIYLVIGILQDYRGLGIGTQLFERAEAWCRAKGIHRMELTVIAKNAPAVHLYKKMGFEIEGVKRDSIFMDGSFLDEYYMAKLI